MQNTGTGAPPNDIPVLQKSTVLSTQDCGFLYIFKIDSQILYFFNNHTRRSVNTCVISESCKNDRCFLACCKSIFLIVFLNTVDQWLSGFGNTTADNDGFRICHTCKHGKCSAKHFSYLCHNIAGYFVALFKSIQNILC